MPWNCPHCRKAVHLEVIERWAVTPDGDEDFPPCENAVARCSTCLAPFVLYHEWDPDPAEPSWTQSYPSPGRTFQRDVPKTVRDAFDEGQKARQNGLWTAAAIMARRTVEAVCYEHNYRARTLVDNLRKMRDDAVIDKRLYEWSSLVKDLGNEGAHDLQRSISREDATEALGFAEALVDYLYVIRKRYDRIVRRRRERDEDDARRAAEDAAQAEAYEQFEADQQKLVSATADSPDQANETS